MEKKKKVSWIITGVVVFIAVLILILVLGWWSLVIIIPAFIIFLIKAGLSRNKTLRFISTFIFQLIGGIILAGVLFLICLLGVGFFKLMLGWTNVAGIIIILPVAIFIGVVGFYSVVFLKFIYLQIILIISFGTLSAIIRVEFLFFLVIYVLVGLIALLIHGRGNIKESFFERAWKRS